MICPECFEQFEKIKKGKWSIPRRSWVCERGHEFNSYYGNPKFDSADKNEKFSNLVGK